MLALHFARQFGQPELVDLLARTMSASQANSLLLEVFRSRAAQTTPAALLRSYRDNRFVQPASLDPLAFLQFELMLLQLAAQQGFRPLELSPLSPLGACSAVGPTSQHKIVSALRGTEVTADATNVLALESARRRKEAGFPVEPMQFCTVHRHVRAQALAMPWHTAHFKVFCMTTAGRDTGDFRFERISLLQHWDFYRNLLHEKLGLPTSIRLKALPHNPAQRRFIEDLATETQRRGWMLSLATHAPDEQPYYRLLQAKIIVRIDDQDIEIADCGFTDWTQRLLENRKERLLISGMGSEILFKMLPTSSYESDKAL